MKIKTSLMTGFLALAVAAPVSLNAGLLGENYVGAGISYNEIRLSGAPNPNGWGAAVGGNMAIHRDAQFGFDVEGSLSYMRLSRSGARARGTVLNVSPTVYIGDAAAKPFVSFDTGWVWARASSGTFSMSDDSWHWGFTSGVEFGVSDTLSITPSLSWTRIDSDRESTWSGGVTVHNWFTEQVGGAVSYYLTEGPEKAHGVMVAVNFRL